jgi:pimeloyl-ACP methyl ester carboxylesterase
MRLVFHCNCLNLLRTGALMLLLCFMSCNRYYFQSLHEDKASIYHFEMLRIEGVKHAVLIRGRDRTNPVMIFLHGGPGFPLFPFEPKSETMVKMEEMYTMVYWEQRGTGKSFSRSIPRESMSIEQFVEDTRQVTEYALALSGQEKVFVWGHSWGSNIGVLFADQYPEMIYAYIGTGQSVNPFKNERLCYRFVEEQARLDNNRRALRQLQWIDTIPENYALEDALTVRRWVYKYGGIVRRQEQQRPYVDWQEMQAMLTAAEYSLIDRLGLIMRPYYSIAKLWDEMKVLDLKERVPDLLVPVYFLLGRYDIIVSASLAESYFEMLEAPGGKQLIWFEESAHRPHHEEQEKFLQLLEEIKTNHWTIDTLSQPFQSINLWK